jgi:hypothetical protein
MSAPSLRISQARNQFGTGSVRGLGKVTSCCIFVCLYIYPSLFTERVQGSRTKKCTVYRTPRYIIINRDISWVHGDELHLVHVVPPDAGHPELGCTALNRKWLHSIKNRLHYTLAWSRKNPAPNKWSYVRPMKETNSATVTKQFQILH